MRFVLALVFVLCGGSAWAQCTNSDGSLHDITKCPGNGDNPAYYDSIYVNPSNPIQGNGSALTGLPPTGNPQLTITAATSNASGSLGSLPANGYAGSMRCHETANHMVTIAIGTTSGGSDVVSGLTVTGEGTMTYTPFATPNWFSATAPQPLYLSSASWGGASLNCNLVYQVGP